MRRLLAWVVLIFLAVTIEATLPALSWARPFRPLLHIPLVVFFALRLGTIEGALLSFLAGALVDVTVPYAFGLASFTDVAIFVIARLFLGGIRSDNTLIEATFVFVMAGLFHLLTFGLRRLVGEPVSLPDGSDWMTSYLLICGSTAAISPLLFRLARRVESLRARQPGALL